MAGTVEQTQTCILVLGMHRSGTSALTRVLSLLGATLPRDLNKGTPSDIVDYWEPIPIVECHNEILWAIGSRWNDWRTFKPDDLPAGSFDSFKGKITGLVATQFGNSPLFVLKDPRISRFVLLYRDILKDMGITPRYVLTLRNPLAVMKSLRERDNMTPGFAGLVWLRHMLDAEQATRGGLRVIVSYERLMAGWRPVVANIAAGLGLTWPTPSQAAAPAIDTFLTPTMQHHSFADHDLENRSEIPTWIKLTYQSLRLLEQHPDRLSALATLDSVRAEFDRWAPIFGEAFFPQLADSESERDTVRTELLTTQAMLRNEAE